MYFYFMSDPTATAEQPSDFSRYLVPDLSRLVTAREFHELVDKNEASGALVAKDFEEVAISRAAEGAGRRFKFTLTAGSVDRDRDVISPKGLDFSEFEKNPIWLWSHTTGGMCTSDKHVALIGVVTEIRQLRNRTDVTVEYAPAEVNPLAESVVQMHSWRLETKALQDRGGACSIGALPRKYARNQERGGIDFEEMEVLEGSDCMLPSNRDSLMRMKSAGVHLDPVHDWAEKYRSLEGAVELDAARAQAIAEALDPARGLKLFELGATELRTIGKELRDKALEAGYEPPATDRESRVVREVCRGLKPIEAKLDRMVEALEKLAAEPVEKPTEESTPPSKESTPRPGLSKAQAEALILEIADREFVARTGQPLTTS